VDVRQRLQTVEITLYFNTAPSLFLELLFGGTVLIPPQLCRGVPVDYVPGLHVTVTQVYTSTLGISELVVTILACSLL
jgi:hypothetical protein